MTDEELLKLEELEEKATDGPWQFEDREGDWPSSFIWSTTSNSGTDEADNCHNRLFCLGGEQSPHPKTKCIRFRQPNKPLFASAEEYCASTLARPDIE